MWFWFPSGFCVDVVRYPFWIWNFVSLTLNKWMKGRNLNSNILQIQQRMSTWNFITYRRNVLSATSSKTWTQQSRIQSRKKSIGRSGVETVTKDLRGNSPDKWKQTLCCNTQHCCDYGLEWYMVPRWWEPYIVGPYLEVFHLVLLLLQTLLVGLPSFWFLSSYKLLSQLYYNVPATMSARVNLVCSVCQFTMGE